MQKIWVLRLSVLLIICFFTVSLSSPAIHATETFNLSGQVVDATTQQPLNNATIAIWNTQSAYHFHWRLVERTQTNSEGQYQVTISADNPNTNYIVYFYHNNSQTPGFDYVPGSIEFSHPSEDMTFSVQLYPAASIVFEGEYWFVEATKPSQNYQYIVHTDPSYETNYTMVSTFGTIMHNFLNTSAEHVIVPLDRGFDLEVNASLAVSDRVEMKTLQIPDATPSAQGSLQSINIEQYTIQLNLHNVETQLHESRQLLQSLEEKEFYTVVEKSDLTQIESQMEVVKAQIEEQRFRSAFIELKEAYIGNQVLFQRLQAIFFDANGSVGSLIFFFALTAVVLTLFFFDRLRSQIIVYIVILTVFLAIFYFVYPGSRLITFIEFIGYSSVATGGVYLLTVILRRVLRDKTVSTFALSKRNLRRRQTRFLLTLVTVLVLVMSFVSFTSFATGYGFTVQREGMPPQQDQDAWIMVQAPQTTVASSFSFVPVDAITVESLQLITEIVSVAPKRTTQPELIALGSFESPRTSQSISYRGVIGISPEAETVSTHVSEIIVEGRFLEETDINCVLLEQQLAHEEGIEVNMLLTFQPSHSVLTLPNVTVIGLFDSQRLRSIKELNGDSFVPSKLVRFDIEDFPVERDCAPQEVLITTFADALTFARVEVSRLNVGVDPTTAPSVAKELVLGQGLVAWFIESGSLHIAQVAEYLEGQGSVIFVPWIIVIFNVIITMLNSVYESRKEISILSSVGLNPTDIIGLFIAEAAVIGILGGGLGYLVGISNYKILAGLSIVIEVRPKVSVLWSFASIALSVAAVLVGALVALRSSVVITPSLLRRWSVKKDVHRMGEPWIIDIPFKVKDNEIENLFNYISARYHRYLKSIGTNPDVGEIRHYEIETVDVVTKTVEFYYLLGSSMGSRVGSFPFQLVASKAVSDEAFTFQVICKGGEDNTEDTVSFLRMSIIEWSTYKTVANNEV
jgi:ABC-type lipoprotein release transport system permease subunit